MCGCDRFLNLDYWGKYNLLTYVKSESDTETGDTEYYAQYQGVNYYETPLGFYCSGYDLPIIAEQFTLVSWCFNLPFGMVRECYADSSDSPNLIFDRAIINHVWVKESFDFIEQTYIIEGTETEIIFSEAFHKNETTEKTYDGHSVDLIFKEQPLFRFWIGLFQEDGVYYISWAGENCSYKVSEKFLQMLTESGLLE